MRVLRIAGPRHSRPVAFFALDTTYPTTSVAIAGRLVFGRRTRFPLRTFWRPSPGRAVLKARFHYARLPSPTTLLAAILVDSVSDGEQLVDDGTVVVGLPMDRQQDAAVPVCELRRRPPVVMRRRTVSALPGSSPHPLLDCGLKRRDYHLLRGWFRMPHKMAGYGRLTFPPTTVSWTTGPDVRFCDGPLAGATRCCRWGVGSDAWDEQLLNTTCRSYHTGSCDVTTTRNALRTLPVTLI